MTIYSLKHLNEFEGSIKVYALCRGENNRCDSTDFIKEIEKDGNLSRQLNRMFSVIEDYCNDAKLPEEKLKDITNNDSKEREIEAKTKNLRFYMVRVPHPINAAIILIAGKKTSQKKDIAKFKEIVKELKRNNQIYELNY